METYNCIKITEIQHVTVCAVHYVHCVVCVRVYKL